MSEVKYIERYWRDAKPEDAIKEPPMVARFRMYGDVPWKFGELHGTHKKDNRIWFDKKFCNSWTICQVYDAPDPGEGWRLIDTENEQPQDGDEIYLSREGKWQCRKTPFQTWAKSFNRRRITPTVTYVPFTWEDREQLRGRWIYRNGFPENEFFVATISRGSNGMLYAHGIGSERLCAEYLFVDTGKPVGKEVTQ